MFSSAYVSPPVGFWTSLARTEANHEAAHALAAELLSVPIIEARIDQPEPGVLGHVVHDKLPPEASWKHLAILLAPHLVTDRCPEFPLSLHSDDHDVFMAACIAYETSMTEAEYDNATNIIRELLEIGTSQSALKALASALLEHGLLQGDEVRRIIRDAEQAHRNARKQEAS